MKSNELRIGNMVIYEKTNHIVTGIYGELVMSRWIKQPENEPDYSCNIAEISPIPLTEEWLVKMGFETDKIVWWNGLMSVAEYKEGFFYLPTSQIHLIRGQRINYVHQLMNLYFALTGKELVTETINN